MGDIGFKKPPEETRFQKGKSGNPKGRPKGSADLRKVFMKEINSLIRVTEGGKSKRLSKLEAFTKRLTNDALGGNMKAAQLFVRLMSIIGNVPEAEVSEALHEDDLAILRRYTGKDDGPA